MSHPWGCHRPRIADRIVFDKLIQVLVLGASYAKIADTTCSATTLRARRDEWIDAGIFLQLEQLCLEFYDRLVGLDLETLSVDGCIVKAPCGREVAGKSPVDRCKLGTNRPPLIDGEGIPWGVCSSGRTGMIPLCCARLWRHSAGSALTCRRRSPCIWASATTRTRPGIC